MSEKEVTQKDSLGAIGITGTEKLEGGPAGLVADDKTLPEDVETKIVRTCCRACIAKCGVLAHVKNGRVVKLEGDPEHPMSKGALCAKGMAGIQALYHPNRNKYPMLRVGERGENKWKRISWTEAINLIADKLMKAREEYGAESLVCSTGGGGNPEFMSAGRFCSIFGSPNWFEPGSSQCYMPRTMSYHLMYGKTNQINGTTSIADTECEELFFPEDTKMKTLVMWGTAPSYSCPAMGGRAVSEMRLKGVKTVVIDPRMTADAAKADVWLDIRPGTDVALQLCWIKYILEHKLYDEEFVMKWTNLPILVNPKTKMCLRESDIKDGGDPKTYVVWDKKTQSAKALPFPWDDDLEPALDGAYTVKGMECKTGFRLLWERAEPYTLEKAAEICWLDAGLIEKAIKLYADTPSGLSLGVATDQTANATGAAMGAATLDIIMGNVQRPGSLLQNFKPVDCAEYVMSPLYKFLTEEQFSKRLGTVEFKGMLSWGVAHNPTLLKAIKTGKPYKPRIWIERSGNKLATLANPTEWVEAMKEMDFIVHMFMYPTSFSAYADLLLPAAEWLETLGTFASLNCVMVRQAVTHTWETMIEADFWIKLSKRMAELGDEKFKDAFDPEKTFPEPPYRDSLLEMVDAGCRAGLGVPYEEVLKKVPYEVYPVDEWRQYYTYKQINPKTGKPVGFGTRSKKLEVYGEAFVQLGRTGAPFAIYPLPPAPNDYEALPYYVEPYESPLEGSELAKKYPLVMTNGRLPFNHHTTLRNIPWLREIYPVPEIWIHPKAAEKYGISQGDWVWVESLRGKITAKAYVTKGINPGTVYMERFWNPETLNTETHGWKEMNVNVLSKNDAPFDDVCGTTVLRGYLVSVTKADGPPEGVWTKPEDFRPWLPEPSAPTEEVKV